MKDILASCREEMPLDSFSLEKTQIIDHYKIRLSIPSLPQEHIKHIKAIVEKFSFAINQSTNFWFIYDPAEQSKNEVPVDSRQAN